MFKVEGSTVAPPATQTHFPSLPCSFIRLLEGKKKQVLLGMGSHVPQSSVSFLSMLVLGNWPLGQPVLSYAERVLSSVSNMKVFLFFFFFFYPRIEWWKGDKQLMGLPLLGACKALVHFKSTNCSKANSHFVDHSALHRKHLKIYEE